MAVMLTGQTLQRQLEDQEQSDSGSFFVSDSRVAVAGLVDSLVFLQRGHSGMGSLPPVNEKGKLSISGSDFGLQLWV